MGKANVAEKALIGMAVTLAAQQFDDLKESVKAGKSFSNQELEILFGRTEELFDELTKFFVSEVTEESK